MDRAKRLVTMVRLPRPSRGNTFRGGGGVAGGHYLPKHNRHLSPPVVTPNFAFHAGFSTVPHVHHVHTDVTAGGATRWKLFRDVFKAIIVVARLCISSSDFSLLPSRSGSAVPPLHCLECQGHLFEPLPV